MSKISYLRPPGLTLPPFRPTAERQSICRAPGLYQAIAIAVVPSQRSRILSATAQGLAQLLLAALRSLRPRPLAASPSRYRCHWHNRSAVQQRRGRQLHLIVAPGEGCQLLVGFDDGHTHHAAAGGRVGFAALARIARRRHAQHVLAIGLIGTPALLSCWVRCLPGSY